MRNNIFVCKEIEQNFYRTIFSDGSSYHRVRDSTERGFYFIFTGERKESFVCDPMVLEHLYTCVDHRSIKECIALVEKRETNRQQL